MSKSRRCPLSLSRGRGRCSTQQAIPGTATICDLWQIDGTQVSLADGSKAWIVDLIDDHARYAIGAYTVRRFTVNAAWTEMEKAAIEHGAPRQLISFNGLQFRSRTGHNRSTSRNDRRPLASAS